MSELVLHGLPVSTYVRTLRMACHRKGLAFTFRPLEFRSPAHAALHPWMKMPVLEQGDVRLFESLAIASWLDHLAPAPRLIPEDPLQKAVALQWTSAIGDYLFHPALQLVFAKRRGEEPLEADVAAVNRALGILDEAMDATGWLGSDEPTLPDLVLFPLIDTLQRRLGDGWTEPHRRIRHAHDVLSRTPEALATAP